MIRSTRVLEHPDGSCTVEFLVEALVKSARDDFAIPKRVKRWAVDPGFMQRPGFVGQHVTKADAEARALLLTTCDEDGIFARVVALNIRPEDHVEEIGGTVQ